MSEGVEVTLMLNGELGALVSNFIAANGQHVVQNSTVYVITLMASPPRHLLTTAEG